MTMLKGRAHNSANSRNKLVAKVTEMVITVALIVTLKKNK